MLCNGSEATKVKCRGINTAQQQSKEAWNTVGADKMKINTNARWHMKRLINFYSLRRLIDLVGFNFWFNCRYLFHSIFLTKLPEPKNGGTTCSFLNLFSALHGFLLLQ